MKALRASPTSLSISYLPTSSFPLVALSPSAAELCEHYLPRVFPRHRLGVPPAVCTIVRCSSSVRSDEIAKPNQTSPSHDGCYSPAAAAVLCLVIALYRSRDCRVPIVRQRPRCPPVLYKVRSAIRGNPKNNSSATGGARACHMSWLVLCLRCIYCSKSKQLDFRLQR